MTKQEFLDELRSKLSGISQEDAEERIAFYSEMIDDRIEEGLSEEEAVRDIGDIDSIVSQILSDISLVKLVKKKIKPKRRLEAWEIVLIILGAPIWVTVLVSVLSVILSVYAAVWSVIVSLWAVFGTFCGCGAAGLLSGIGIVFDGDPLSGVVLIGAGLVCGGLAILMYFGCDGATKGIIGLTKKGVLAIKKCFVRGEDAK